MLTRVECEAFAPDGKRRTFWFVFASDHADLAAVSADLKTHGHVAGWRLDTERDGAGGRRETKRYPIILGTHGLVNIQPFTDQAATPAVQS